MRKTVIFAAVTLCACYESTDFTLYSEGYPTGRWPATASGLWEGFERGTFDLEGYSLHFEPDREPEVWYWRDAEPGLRDFPFRPGSGASSTVLELGDDDYARYELGHMGALRFYGVRYEELYVSSNGFVTFGQGSSSLSDTPEEHFSLPTVSGLRGDLDPRVLGRVVVDEWATAVVVTYEGVPAYSETSPNDVQIVLRTNGDIDLHYVRVSNDRSWLVGTSNGLRGPMPNEVDFVAGPIGQEHCGDGIDNDRDGYVDCDDPDCASNTAYCGGHGEEIICWDGIDNDSDGDVDCYDSDCWAECTSELDCFNGWDDDSDGRVDCDDPDCFYEMGCITERECRNVWDDDGDGYIDCDDPDCWGDPYCDTPCRGYWEAFDSDEEEDLSGRRLVFQPAPDHDQGYLWTGQPGLDELRVEPGSGVLSVEYPLSDDSSAQHWFDVMGSFPFFGSRFDHMYVSSNGYVTFGRGDSSLGFEPWSHFALPGIAVLRGDLNPAAGGTVIVDELAERTAITFLDVPWYGDTRASTVQIVLESSGEIELDLLSIAYGHQRYLVGISNGCASEEYPEESDFST